MTGGREGPGEHAPKRRERRQALHAMIAERNMTLAVAAALAAARVTSFAGARRVAVFRRAR